MRTEALLVVVPTLDEAEHIQGVLDGLLAEAPSFRRMRIVVTDGGSTDGTVALVAEAARRHPEITFLHNPARIQSAAINLAARRLGRDADVLIRCDAHARYPAQYCLRLVESLDRASAGGQADAVVVPLDSTGETCLQRAVAWLSNT